MYFLIADQLLIFDRVAQTIMVLVNAVVDEAGSPQEAYENAVSEIDRLVSLLEQPSEHHPVSVLDEAPEVPFESNITRERFFENVRKSNHRCQVVDAALEREVGRVVRATLELAVERGLT